MNFEGILLILSILIQTINWEKSYSSFYYLMMQDVYSQIEDINATDALRKQCSVHPTNR